MEFGDFDLDFDDTIEFEDADFMTFELGVSMEIKRQQSVHIYQEDQIQDIIQEKSKEIMEIFDFPSLPLTQLILAHFK